MKVWEENYNGNIIKVENSWTGERLIVNGVLQDEQLGYGTRSRLWGSLPSGEKIKVSLGGWVSIHCIVFVDNKLLFSR